MNKSINAIFFFLLLCFLLPGTQTIGQSDTTNATSLNVEIFDIAWSPDGELLAIANNAGIKILTTDLHAVADLQEHNGNVVSVAWNPDGTQLASSGGADDAIIRIWKRDTNSTDFTLQTVVTTEYARIPSIAWSPDGKRLAGLGILNVRADQLIGKVTFWNTQTWTETITSLYSYGSPLMNVVWSPDSMTVAGGGYTICPETTSECSGNFGGVYILNTNSGEQIESIEINFVPQTLDWSQNNSLAFTLFNVLSIVDTKSWYIVNELEYLMDHLDWSPNNSDLIVGNDGQNIQIVNTRTGQDIKSVEQAQPGLHRLAWHPIQNKIAVAYYNGDIEIWDVGELRDSSEVPTLTPIATPSPRKK